MALQSAVISLVSKAEQTHKHIKVLKGILKNEFKLIFILILIDFHSNACSFIQ